VSRRYKQSRLVRPRKDLPSPSATPPKLRIRRPEDGGEMLAQRLISGPEARSGMWLYSVMTPQAMRGPASPAGLEI
jgi:hypothetical protein